MKNIQLSLILAVLVLSGCVTGTRNIELNAPEFSNQKSASGPIYIDIIEDQRTFESKPRSPSTPSVKGSLETTSKEKLSTLIGRQRNGYGAAMGDVALPEGATVQDKMRQLLTQGLESRGYTVINDSSAEKKMSVEIEKFWAWFSPGVWAVSFESTLQCKINIEGDQNSQTFDIAGYGINKGQVASNANWTLAYQRAFLDFLENLDKALDNAGL